MSAHDAVGDGAPATEEPWEAEIGSLLGRLPPVDPPAGFIDRAIDHRPLHAGRVVSALGAVTVVAVLVALATGVVGRSGVVPPIDELVARHDSAAQAGLTVDVETDDVEEDGSPVELPDGFRPAGTVAAEEIRQAVYARGDESVSVFVQDGPVDWSLLAPEGLTELGGLQAWVDGGRRIVVLETDGSIVTIIGLEPDELDRTLRALPGGEPSPGAEARRLAEAIVVQLGYAPTG